MIPNKPDTKSLVLSLLLQGKSQKDIQKEHQLSRRFVEPIAKEISGSKNLSGLMRTRLESLIPKEPKTLEEVEEIAVLTDKYLKAQKQEVEINSYLKSNKPKDLNPEKYEKNGRPKNKSKNDISKLTAEIFEEHFFKKLFAYQRNLYDHKEKRVRNIIKSRQIGLTYYFALEALHDAVMTGRNQIFLSASKAQSHIFLNYIKLFAWESCELELKGKDSITLSNGAQFIALSSNSKTSQGFHGNVYFDEYFWAPKWKELKTLASAQASHKQYHLTYFSTPSSTQHEAYEFWSGEYFNADKPKKEQIHLDISKRALRKGRMDPDGQWRRVITLATAEEEGCDLFDVNQLKKEHSKADFKLLFECEFLDESESLFSLQKLNKCLVELNFNPKLARPAGNRKVWLGFDPSRSIDASTLVVVLPPSNPTEKFQILEIFRWYSENFQTQANNIKYILDKYDVAYLGIDATGIGAGVFELVQQFYPRATKLVYGEETKNLMIIKTQNLIDNSRIEWDTKHHQDIARSFLMIKRKITSSGKIIYETTRNKEQNHADIAWAIMNAVINEPLNENKKRGGVVFSV